MDALKQQLLKVQQQLAGLSASQKMLTASLLVIMVMTLFYWSNVAGRSETEAVNDTALSGSDLAAVQNAVQAKGIKYEVRDGKVYVPVGKRDEVASVLDQLAYDGALPPALAKPEDDNDAAFSFASESVRQSHAQEKRRKRVEGMIARWPGVRSVQVIIAGDRQTGIMHDSVPTASVSIETKGGSADLKKLVMSARRQIVGAQPGLKGDDVVVTIDGQTYDAENANNPIGSSDSQFAAKKNGESYYKRALLDQLRDIDGVRATVVVKLNTADVTTSEHAMDPKNTAIGLQQETTSETSTPLPPPNGEPGATANMGVNADPNATPAETAAKTDTRSKTNKVEMSFRNTETRQIGGEVSAATAVVSVPESYFRRIWKSRKGGSGEPKEEDLRATMDEWLPRIQRQAMLAVNIKDKAAVDVSTYFDFEPTPVADSTAGAGLAALPTGSGFGAKEIAVAALAVISLFMVSMMVRKSAPQPVLAGVGMGMGSMSATDAVPEGKAMLTVGDVIAQATEGNLSMAGHELSPEAIEATQVIEQVGTMVKANPDIAANLVKRWLNQD